MIYTKGDIYRSAEWELSGIDSLLEFENTGVLVHSATTACLQKCTTKETFSRSE